jgi:hypothetical protein
MLPTLPSTILERIVWRHGRSQFGVDEMLIPVRHCWRGCIFLRLSWQLIVFVVIGRHCSVFVLGS